MEATNEVKLTRQEKWRIYDAFYKKKRYDSEPEYRQRKQLIALTSYYKRKSEKLAAEAKATAAPANA